MWFHKKQGVTQTFSMPWTPGAFLECSGVFQKFLGRVYTAFQMERGSVSGRCEAACPECWQLGVTLSAPHSVPSRGGSSLVLQDASPSTRHHSPAHIRCCRVREATMSASRTLPDADPSWGQSYGEITAQIWDLKHMERREL